MNPQHLTKSPLSSRLIFVLGTLLLSPCLVFSQLNIEWEHTYGGVGWDELQTMALTSDGGYIFGSFTTTRTAGYEVSQDTRDTVYWPALEGDFWIVKTDGLGNIEWDKRYGGENQDRLWNIVQTNDGGYILAGESTSGYWMEKTAMNWGGYDYWMVKIDAVGNMEWQKSYGGNHVDVLRTVIPLSDGYLIAGYSGSDASPVKDEGSRGFEDYWVIRTDLLGNPMWQKVYGGTGQDVLYEAKQVPGGILLVGWSTSGVGFEKSDPAFGGQYTSDVWIVKINENGDVLWENSFGGDGIDNAFDAIQTLDGNYILTGFSSSNGNNSGPGNKSSARFGGEDAWLVKISPNGDYIWDKSYGSTSKEIAYSVAENGIGNLLVIGMTSSIGSSETGEGNQEDTLIGSNDYWALYLEPDGDKKWDMVLGGTGADVATKILKAHDYGYIFGGHSDSPPSFYKSQPCRNGNDMWVVRLGCLFPEPWLEDVPRTCQNEEFELDGSLTFCDGCEYLWDDGFTEPIRTVAPSIPTQYKVTVFHPDGCETTDSMLVEIVPGPEELFAAQKDVSCFNESDGAIYMDTVTGGTPPYLYSLNGGEYQDAVDYVNMPPGVYQVSILDANNCPLDTTLYITQPQEVLVELGEDIFLDLGEKVQLQALTNQTDSFSVSWGQTTILDCSDCLEPLASPSYSTTVSVRILDKNGCEAIDNQRLIIKKGDSVYIPTAFSPNLDNINDFFTIYADHQVRKVNSMFIFDRWGEKMFELHDFQPNVDQIGWDGKLDGKYMRPAVFGYWIEVEYLDGRTEFFEGDFTLVR